jgi:hypothetical protein
VDLDEILYGDNDVEDDIDSLSLNPVASTIPKWRTLKLLRWCKFLNDWWIWMEFCMEVMQFKIYLYSILLNPIASTIPKWQTFKFLR